MNEFISKADLIDKIYALNGSSCEKVDEVYGYDDSEYGLRLRTAWDNWRICVVEKTTHSMIIEIYHNKNTELINTLKITKKEAKTISDFVFLAWNSRK